MPMKGLTPSQKEMDRIVKALNSKISKIAKEYGTDSRAYQQIYEILSGYNAAGRMRNRFSILSVGFTREKDGVIQISRSRKALADLEIKQYMKALKRVAQLPSAAEIRKNIVNAWKEAHATIDPKTGEKKLPKVSREDAKQIVQDAMKADKTIASRLEAALAEVYKLQSKYGYEFKEMADIKKLSRGRFTSAEDLEKMIAAAEEIVRNERKQVQDDLFAGY